MSGPSREDDPGAARRGTSGRMGFTMTPSLSAVLMVAFVCAAVVIGLWMPWVPDDEDERLRDVPVPAAAATTITPLAGAPAPALRVLFRADARESELRQMLLAQRLVVVAGPTTLGEYWLRPGEGSAADLQAAAQTLLASGLATHAVIDERGGPGRH